MVGSRIDTIVRNTTRIVYGTPLFAVQHGWRQRYLQRREMDTDEFSEPPPDAVPTTSGSNVQSRIDGTGPLVMRTYTSHIRDAQLSPVELITRFCDDPNSFSPQHIAGFHTPDGQSAQFLNLGEEYVVEIPGPWNGPVRVDEVTDTSFTLITLDGHMEAGHIRFAATSETSGRVEEFQIRSWARAGDPLFEHLHLTVGIGREAQTAMWVHTCDRAIEISGGRRDGPIDVSTEILSGSQRDQRR